MLGVAYCCCLLLKFNVSVSQLLSAGMCLQCHDHPNVCLTGTETSEKSNEKKEGQSKPDTSKTAKDNKDSGSQQCLATHL